MSKNNGTRKVSGMMYETVEWFQYHNAVCVQSLFHKAHVTETDNRKQNGYQGKEPTRCRGIITKKRSKHNNTLWYRDKFMKNDEF